MRLEIKVNCIIDIQTKEDFKMYFRYNFFMAWVVLFENEDHWNKNIESKAIISVRALNNLIIIRIT